VSFLSGGTPPEIFLPQPDHTLLVNPLVGFPQGGKTYAGTGYVNSGILVPPGATFTVTFTKPGRYTYVCILHQGMSGTVIVQAAGSKYPMTQAAYDRVAASQKAAALRAGERLRASQKVAAAKGTAGTIYSTSLISDTGARVSYFGFAPSALRVRAGDTVRWVLKDPYEIHTITFPFNQTLQEFVMPQPQPQGPPKLMVNTQASAPVGGAVYAGDAFLNSGILTPPGAPGPKEFVLKFTKPGTYTYWCVVHVPEGMRGTIVVQ